MKSNDHLILGLASLIAFLAIGAMHWPPAYNQVGLPNSLYGFWLIAVPLGAACVRLNPKISLWQSTLALGCAVPAAVFARVAVETTLDPTSHSLWPFELILAAGVGFPVAFVGALVGGLIAPWWRDRSASS